MPALPASSESLAAQLNAAGPAPAGYGLAFTYGQRTCRGCTRCGGRATLVAVPVDLLAQHEQDQHDGDLWTCPTHGETWVVGAGADLVGLACGCDVANEDEDAQLRD